MSREMLSTQDIVRRHHISYQTVNYYTNLGLLTVRRKNGNTRYFKAGEVRKRLDDIAKFKSKGYSLKLIRDLLRG